ncbi:MAG: HAD family hydrolase [Granulosicoccaceae bacterium]
MPLTPLATKKHWLFDMDGTLTHALHDFEAIKVQLGLPTEKPILESLADLPTDIAIKKHQLLDEIEFEIAELATPQAGSTELLQSLIDQGCNVGIVTRNGKGIAKTTLKACGLDHFFTDANIIGRDCAAPKPAPDGVTLLLSRWNAAATDGVMIGDYLYDLVAGRKAGTATVHFDVVDRGIWPEWTDHKIGSLTELLAAVS